MAQETGTQILARARLFAQDTATTSPAVSDANALILLNEVLVRFTQDTEQKVSPLAASGTGLTFAANQTMQASTYEIEEPLSFHPSDTNAANNLLSPALQLISVREMLDIYDDAGAGTQTGASSEWKLVAFEKVGGGSENAARDFITVYVWPPLNRTRYMTVRAAQPVTITALTKYPDISQRDAHIVSRLLAWEMARLHTREQDFLQEILAPVPKQVLESYFRSGARGAWLPSGVKSTDALDG